MSHSSQDRERALALRTCLEADGGVEVWLSETGIAGGSNYAEEIPRQIESCDCVVVLESRAAWASPHVRREMDLAVRGHRLIVPVVLEHALLDSADRPRDWFYFIGIVQAIEWTDADAVAKLIRAAIGDQDLSPAERAAQAAATALEERRYRAKWRLREAARSLARRFILLGVGSSGVALAAQVMAGLRLDWASETVGAAALTALGMFVVDLILPRSIPDLAWFYGLAGLVAGSALAARLLTSAAGPGTLALPVACLGTGYVAGTLIGFAIRAVRPTKDLRFQLSPLWKLTACLPLISAAALLAVLAGFAIEPSWLPAWYRDPIVTMLAALPQIPLPAEAVVSVMGLAVAMAGLVLAASDDLSRAGRIVARAVAVSAALLALITPLVATEYFQLGMLYGGSVLVPLTLIRGMFAATRG